jgi:hypothetical protein
MAIPVGYGDGGKCAHFFKFEILRKWPFGARRIKHGNIGSGFLHRGPEQGVGGSWVPSFPKATDPHAAALPVPNQGLEEAKSRYFHACFYGHYMVTGGLPSRATACEVVGRCAL